MLATEDGAPWGLSIVQTRHEADGPAETYPQRYAAHCSHRRELPSASEGKALYRALFLGCLAQPDDLCYVFVVSKTVAVIITSPMKLM